MRIKLISAVADSLKYYTRIGTLYNMDESYTHYYSVDIKEYIEWVISFINSKQIN